MKSDVPRIFQREAGIVAGRLSVFKNVVAKVPPQPPRHQIAGPLQ